MSDELSTTLERQGFSDFREQLQNFLFVTRFSRYCLSTSIRLKIEEIARMLCCKELQTSIFISLRPESFRRDHLKRFSKDYRKSESLSAIRVQEKHPATRSLKQQEIRKADEYPTRITMSKASESCRPCCALRNFLR